MLWIFFSYLSLAGVQIDLENSRVYWQSSMQMGSPHYGEVKIKSAEFQYDDEKLRSALIIMDMKKISITDLNKKMGAVFLEHINDQDYLDVNNHPEASLEFSKIENGSLDGTLKIKGVSQPISIRYNKEDQTYSGQFQFNRLRFNIAPKNALIKEMVGVKFSVKTLVSTGQSPSDE